MTDDELDKIHEENMREDRRIKMGVAAIGGILLLATFSAVCSVANMERQDEPDVSRTERMTPLSPPAIKVPG